MKNYLTNLRIISLMILSLFLSNIITAQTALLNGQGPAVYANYLTAPVSLSSSYGYVNSSCTFSTVPIPGVVELDFSGCNAAGVSVSVTAYRANSSWADFTSGTIPICGLNAGPWASDASSFYSGGSSAPLLATSLSSPDGNYQISIPTYGVGAAISLDGWYVINIKYSNGTTQSFYFIIQNVITNATMLCATIAAPGISCSSIPVTSNLSLYEPHVAGPSTITATLYNSSGVAIGTETYADAGGGGIPSYPTVPFTTLPNITANGTYYIEYNQTYPAPGPCTDLGSTIYPLPVFTPNVVVSTIGGAFTLSYTDVAPSCETPSGGSISVTVTPPTTGLTYTWSDGGTGASRTGLSGGSYSVTVTGPCGSDVTTINLAKPFNCVTCDEAVFKCEQQGCTPGNSSNLNTVMPLGIRIGQNTGNVFGVDAPNTGISANIWSALGNGDIGAAPNNSNLYGLSMQNMGNKAFFGTRAHPGRITSKHPEANFGSDAIIAWGYNPKSISAAGRPNNRLIFEFHNDSTCGTSEPLEIATMTPEYRAPGRNHAYGYVGINTISSSQHGVEPVAVLDVIANKQQLTNGIRFEDLPAATDPITYPNALVADANGNLALSPVSGGANLTCNTINYVPVVTAANTMGCSEIYDNGTQVGISTSTPVTKLDVNGQALFLENGNGGYLAGAGEGLNIHYDAINHFGHMYAYDYGANDRKYVMIQIPDASNAPNPGNSNLGIGTDENISLHPIYDKLDVNGTVRVQNLPATIAPVGIVFYGADATYGESNQLQSLPLSGNNTDVLLGNGTWGTLPTGTGDAVDFNCTTGQIVTTPAGGSPVTSTYGAWLTTGNTAGGTSWFGTNDNSDINIGTNNGSCSTLNPANRQMVISAAGNVDIATNGTAPQNKLLVEQGVINTSPDPYTALHQAIQNGAGNTGPPSNADFGILSVANSTDLNPVGVASYVDEDKSNNTGIATVVHGNYCNGSNGNNTGFVTIPYGDNSVNQAYVTAIDEFDASGAEIGTTNSDNTGFQAFINGGGGSNTGLVTYVLGKSENVGAQIVVGGGGIDNTGITSYTDGGGSSTNTYGGYFQVNEGATGSGTVNNAIYATIGTSSGSTGPGTVSSNECAAFLDGDVYITNMYGPSDENLKTNVQDFKNSLDMLGKLNAKTYDFKTGEYKTSMNLPGVNQIGIMAQNLKSVFPNLVKEKLAPSHRDIKTHKPVGTDTKFLAVNYVGLVPVLVAAVNELNGKTDSVTILKTALENTNTILANTNAKVDALQKQIDDICNGGCASLSRGNTNSDLTNQLLQNVPNPFSQQTTIGYVINVGTTAYMNINSLDGKLVKHLELIVNGAGSVNISSNELTPGTYTYTLVVDTKVVDTKIMVITSRD